MKSCSLRFKKLALLVNASDSCEFAGFTNAVLEFVFALPRSTRGMVERLIWYNAIETETDILDRIARIDAKQNGQHYYFYVVAEANTRALNEWQVTGWSLLLNGAIRLPEESDMIWL